MSGISSHQAAMDYMYATTTFQRSPLAQIADKFAYIPGVGTAIGIARIIANLTMLCFVGVAYLFQDGSNSDKEKLIIGAVLDMKAKRIGGEIERGLLELVPFVTVGIDVNQTYKTERWDWYARGSYYQLGEGGILTYSDLLPQK